MSSQIFSHLLNLPVIHKRAKSRAVQSYLDRLPELLRRRYGKCEPYTPSQVSRTIAEGRFSQRFIEFAYLLHCGEQYLLDNGTEPYQLDELKAFIGQLPQPTQAHASHAGIDPTANDFGLADSSGLGDA